MSRPLADEAAERARDVLRRCAGERGFQASGTSSGYTEVWARDSMVTALGVCAGGLEEFLPAVHASLATLSAHQSTLGRMPVNVGRDGRPGTANAAGCDGTLWFIIGERLVRATFGDTGRPDGASPRHAVERAMLWVRYQDSDEDGLIESHEAANWADLLAYRGKILFDNVLYRLALLAYAGLSESLDLPDESLHRGLAGAVARQLNSLHWVESRDGLLETATSPAMRGEHAEARRLAELTTVALWNIPFYLPWVDFRSWGDWCDVLGNTLAILAGVADERRTAAILEHFEAVGVSTPWPARALHPPISPGDPDWRSYYRNNALNLPFQYQNGGVWPYIGGFLICALVHAGRRDAAAAALDALALCVREGREGPWEFNEWYHGLTGRPMGRPLCAWSAAMYLAAHRAVELDRLPWLDALTEPRT